jgi:mRNA-capping enzyme
MFLPFQWLHCPQKSTIIMDRFIACKIPLDHQYNKLLKESQRWTCEMLIESVQSLNKKLGLVINLTNTERFYDSKVEFQENNILYHHIPHSTEDEMPTNEEVQRFIDICNDFILQDPNNIIAVHCTHGFNRTGFLICTFLCRQFQMNIDRAISHFAESREPGIYEKNYLDALIQNLGNENIKTILKPALPKWCLISSGHDIESNKQSTTSGDNKRSCSDDPSDQSAKRFCQVSSTTSTSRDTIQLPEMVPVLNNPLLNNIREKYRRLCEWPRRGFPGFHPVRMHSGNYQKILRSSYMVTWKPAGKRYMMLIENEDTVYMLDQGDKLSTIDRIRLPRDAECTSYLKNTLVDGELVIDNIDGSNKPCFLINDIIIYNGQDVRKKPFLDRLKLISESIVNIHNNAITKGYINKTTQPFSIRKKDFFNVSAVNKLFSPEFLSTICHEVEGFIFLPETHPYTSGQCLDILKWNQIETIDFRLKIPRSSSKLADLYLNGMHSSFATIRNSPSLQEYDNKIISCSYKDNQWHFHQLRNDRPFPNSKKTADDITNALQRSVTREAICDLIKQQSKTQAPVDDLTSTI